MPVRFVLLLAWAASLPAPAQPAADPLAGITSAETEELLQWLSRHAVDPAALSQDALNRAALRSLVQDGRSGARLMEKAALPPSPPLHARLGPSAAYARPGPLLPENIHSLKTFLTALPPETGTLVLDLRAPQPPEPFAGAALLAGLFCPDKTPLFRLHSSAGAALQTSSGPSVWDRRVWLLVDDRSPPAAALAAHLIMRHAAALTFGSTPMGTLTESTDRPLGPDHVVRLPSATVFWPDGTPLTGTPLVPQLLIPPQPDSRGALLALTDPDALPALLRETDRPRLNEAALMAGTQPEPTATHQPTPALRPDPVLQQAADLLETSAVLKLDAPEEIKRAGTGPPSK